jgi:hypothetical protein
LDKEECGAMPSDFELRDRFFQKQSDFVRLVQMSNQDQHVTVISSNVAYFDSEMSWPRKDIGFSEERWNEYRRMFRTLDIDGGLSRRTHYPFAVFVNAYASGDVSGSSGKGYVYSEKSLSLLVNSLDVMPRDLNNKNRGHAIVFEALTNHWYMFR